MLLLPLALLGTLALGPVDALPPDTVPAAALIPPTAPSIPIGAPFRPPRIPVSAFALAPQRDLPSALVPAASVGVGPRRSGTAVAPPPREIIEYSDAYFTRLTIHKWASYLMLPLFAGEYVVGQKLINGNGSDNLRGVHGALAGTIAGLFAVNTVTGGWNTIEAWHDPEGRTRRTLHSALMLLADVGFVLTASMANENESEGGQVTSVSNNNHKRMAIASMSTALIGYSVMLPFFGSD